jgi:hypothetical protein
MGRLRISYRIQSAAICAVFPLLLAGCGSSSDDQPASGGGGSGGSSGSGGAAGSGGLAGAAGAAGSGGASACTAPPRSLWTWEMSVMPPGDVQVPATCRGQTDHAYIYVADDAWGTDMDQQTVDTIAKAFDSATPADQQKGIYALDTELYGDPPDVDGDPHIILFYTPIAGFKSYTFDGYFRGDDEESGAHSNQMEMLHLNSQGQNPPESDYMLGVVAHEFVHLIEYRYDKIDEGWAHEALAEAAMTNAGYFTDLPVGKGYVKVTAVTPLCVSGYSDYGATFSWGSYMLDRFGADFLKQLLQDPADGRTSIDAHLPSGTSFGDAFGEFMVACLLDQPSIGDGRWGFSSIDENALGAEAPGTIDGAAHDVKSVAFGAKMLRFTPSGAGTLSLTLASADLAKLLVHSVVFDPADPAAAQVTALDPSATPVDITLGAGQVADLVIAVDGGPAASDLSTAPQSTVSYTATFTP